MSLQEELETKRKEIRTDSYSMSIGELLSLYENKEIEIHPEFQRFFRWSQTQKTRFIESLLIGLPIPQIFVSQRENGIWDVVDGLQRLSTIYEFAGVLRGEDEHTLPNLTLDAADSLPSLMGKKWDDSADPENSLNQAQRLLIKRSKIGVAIIKEESDESNPMAKYELFQRLNTGGSIATDQEIRNCLLIMSNREIYGWLRELSQNEAFQSCISLSDKARQEQYDLELLLRFVFFRNMNEETLGKIPYPDISEFITRRVIELSGKSTLDYEVEKDAFNVTFKILSEQLEDNSFRKYNHQKGGFTGGFLVSVFEAVALGVGYHYEELRSTQINVLDRVKQLWLDTRFTSSLGGSSGGSISTRKRVQNILPIGRELFKA